MNGGRLKQAGQQLALFNAGVEWIEATIENLRAFCKARKQIGRPEFRFEEFREVAAASGWPLPSSHKAWGAVPRVAVKRMLIQSTGRYEPAKSLKTHGHVVMIWQAN